jgi:hypothetical protein
MWFDEQDCPRRKTLYDISQEDIVIDIPCFSQRLPIPFTLVPPSLLQATKIQS